MSTYRELTDVLTQWSRQEKRAMVLHRLRAFATLLTSSNISSSTLTDIFLEKPQSNCDQLLSQLATVAKTPSCCDDDVLATDVVSLLVAVWEYSELISMAVIVPSSSTTIKRNSSATKERITSTNRFNLVLDVIEVCRQLFLRRPVFDALLVHVFRVVAYPLCRHISTRTQCLDLVPLLLERMVFYNQIFVK